MLPGFQDQTSDSGGGVAVTYQLTVSVNTFISTINNCANTSSTKNHLQSAYQLINIYQSLCT
jgi:hypothetical protein